MNVSCPQCRTVYRVDPAKVPQGGIRARCLRCPEEFEVVVPAVEPGATGAYASVSPAGPPPAEGMPAMPTEEVGQDAAPEVHPDAPPAAAAGTAPRLPELEPFGGAEAEVTAAFGTTDPHARARRLARALVSDIVVYNPDRRERSLQQGNIRQEFREEIRKSWDEYAAQVGNEMARETSYFRDALNEILAGGSRLF